jgi:hypothetical protein
MKIQTWFAGANTVIEQISNYAIPDLTPEIIDSSLNFMYTSNYKGLFDSSASYRKSVSDTLYYEFTFFT